MIEYSSPNTNKPLHLGHVRNNLLGWSLAQIMEANGNKVVKTNIVNDRGIHICKSMLAWLKWGNGETPESSGKKGDHLVGDYYVKFDAHYRAEVEELTNKYVADGMDTDSAKEKAKAEASLCDIRAFRLVCVPYRARIHLSCGDEHNGTADFFNHRAGVGKSCACSAFKRNNYCFY